MASRRPSPGSRPATSGASASSSSRPSRVEPDGPPPSKESAGQLTLAAVLSVLLGLSLIGLAIAELASDSPPSPPVLLSIIGAGILEVALAAGILARKRAAWSFALALDGVLLLAGLLAVPALSRAGIPFLLTVGPMGMSAAAFGLLVSARGALPTRVAEA